MDQQRTALAKHWTWTLNNYTAAEEEEIKKWDVEYLIFGHEKGENQTPHLQGYVVFHGRKRLSALKKLQNRIHWAISRGTPQQNRTYCTKEDTNFFEVGILPMTGSQKTQHNWAEIKANAKAGRLDAIPDKIFIDHYQNLKRIRQDYQIRPKDLPDVTGTWFHGDPGVGKSFKVRSTYQIYYDKPCNKWWDGYQDEPVVLVDDFDLNHKVLGHHLKRWGDRYSFPAEMKGTTIQIRPTQIIVTSNYTITEIFGEDFVLVQALKRRYKEIKVVKDWQ